VDALKTGMLGTVEVVAAVAAMIAEAGLTNLVGDPVMVAKSGDHLLAEDAVHRAPYAPPPLALVNHAECAGGGDARRRADPDPGEMRERRGGSMRSGGWVVVKGGHMGGETVTDLLFDGTAFQSLDPRGSTPRTRTERADLLRRDDRLPRHGPIGLGRLRSGKSALPTPPSPPPRPRPWHGPLNHMVKP